MSFIGNYLENNFKVAELSCAVIKSEFVLTDAVTNAAKPLLIDGILFRCTMLTILKQAKLFLIQMSDRLTVAGALPDIQGWPLRPSSWPHRRPPHMTLQKRHTISMQRQLSVEEGGASRLTGNRENAGGGGEEDYYKWEKDMKINRTDGGSMPVISFNSVEENTIELLVVVTRKMLLILKNRLTEYLLATIASVSHDRFSRSNFLCLITCRIIYFRKNGPVHNF